MLQTSTPKFREKNPPVIVILGGLLLHSFLWLLPAARNSRCHTCEPFHMPQSLLLSINHFSPAIGGLQKMLITSRSLSITQCYKPTIRRWSIQPISDHYWDGLFLGLPHEQHTHRIPPLSQGGTSSLGISASAAGSTERFWNTCHPYVCVCVVLDHTNTYN